jgi:hypothetical protein
MTTRSTNGDGLVWSEPTEKAETDWSGWEAWLQSHLAVERNKNGEIFDDLHEALEFTRGDLYKGIERLEREVAELAGAIGVLKGLGPPPGIRFRGSYDPNVDYSIHDIVAKNGSSFVALRDRPGVCPGEHWQLLAGKGDRGQVGPGPRGQTGARGEPAPKIKTWVIDKRKFTASAVLSDGTVSPAIELRALFQEFLDQTRAGA